MSTHTAQPPTTHVVIIGHDDHDTSAIAGALARRLQRPLLDRTQPRESGSTDAADRTDNDAQHDALAWYQQTLHTGCDSVIAAPSILLDQLQPPARPTGVWTVWLDDPTNPDNLIAAGDRTSRRNANARQLCDIRVDTSDDDIDRIIDDIANQWEHKQHTPRNEQHHVR